MTIMSWNEDFKKNYTDCLSSLAHVKLLIANRGVCWPVFLKKLTCGLVSFQIIELSLLITYICLTFINTIVN